MGQHGAASLNCSGEEVTTPLLQLECMQVGCSTPVHPSHLTPPTLPRRPPWRISSPSTLTRWVCHSDELYLFWSPYWFGNYSLNKVTWLTGQGQLHVIYVDTIV